MNRKFFSLLLAVFCLISFVSAWEICIDTRAPEAPEGLIVSGNVILSWDVSDDAPDCSGIEYYNIYLDGDLIGKSFITSYSRSELADGTYTFGVSAVDKGGNEGDKATEDVVFPQSSDYDNEDDSPEVPSSGGGSSGGSSSGGGSSSSSSVESNSSEDVGNNSEVYYNYEENGMSISELNSVEGDSEENFKSNNFFSMITGAVTGTVGTAGGIAVSAFVLLALGGFVFILVRKKNGSNKGKKKKKD
ncbi:MAG: hypothetical protein ABIH79_02340 [archaeon]